MEEAASRAVSDGAAAASAEQAEVPRYDFRQPRLFAPDRLNALDALYGGLCKSVERWLTTRVREPIALTAGEFRLASLEEHVASMTTPTAAYVFSVEGTGRQAIVDFGREFAAYLVDRLLGSNDPPRIPDRPLTVLERMLARMPAEHVAAQLAEAWKEHVKLELRLARFESTPAMLQAGSREEMMLVVPVAVTAGPFAGSFTMALPQAAVERFFAASAAERRPAPPPLVPAGAATPLREVQVGVSVRTAPFAIRLGELSTLTPGNLLETGLPAATELVVRVEGIARFLAQPGRCGRRLAARITQALSAAEPKAMETRGRTGPMASITRDQEKSGAEAFAELAGGAPGAANPLSTLYQVSLPVTIELGRTRMSVQEILALGRGSVIELDRMVGEPVNVMVGDRHFADGEVVVVGENFAVRITRLAASETEKGETP